MGKTRNKTCPSYLVQVLVQVRVSALGHEVGIGACLESGPAWNRGASAWRLIPLFLKTRQPEENMRVRELPELGQELGQGTWTNFITVFLLQSHLSKFRVPRQTWTRTWTRNLDKFYHVFSSYRVCPGNLDKELGQLRAAVLQALSVLRPDFRQKALSVLRPNSRQAPIPCALPLSLEGVFQTDSILPERLPALVRPAFDLVLRRIRSLKRCVQAWGCKIMTPRYCW